ncbi:recQ-mediated genome instability protein 1-like isoform X2 [Venturia canescens]|uniref:recQ-mediated genome instability protein 1-like isoform X2 n=1 Tax=Venturia canescens TaxID=32260 RepID=UPI001C9CBF28|nr:recQ-mediated genome instability protein 1-like isoform X2 [Venturia canescens]
MNNDNLIREVEKRFNAKCYRTNNTWFRDCVEYYLSEHHNATVAEVLEFVIAQWQLSDFREISTEKPCLPANLANEKSTTLQGRFVLQMEKVYDISESKYKQIQKIRSISDDNIKVTEAEHTQANWEPKKKRMLYFLLTDGSQDVVAIEYKPIRFLNDSLLPGYKLLIKGPVACRRGVIMLDETNVDEIGGEVADLLVPNAPENILARALNLPENPDPYKDHEEATTRAVEHTALLNDDFDIDIDDIAIIEADECRVENHALPPADPQQNKHGPGSMRFEKPPVLQSAPVSRTESDLLFDEIDDVIFDEDANFSLDPIPQKYGSSVTASSSNFSTKQSKEVDSDLTAKPKKIEATSRNELVPTTNKNLAQVKPSSTIDTKTDDCPTKRLSGLKINIENQSISTSSTGQFDSIDTLPMKPTETTANKRTSSVLSPPMVDTPAEKMRCPQTTKNSGNNKKITDWITQGVESSTQSQSTANNTANSIASVLATKVMDNDVVHKIIKGKVTKRGSLSKNGLFWQWNATITDSTGSIDTTFSSEVLESMLGFSVEEFSKKRKLRKTDPNIEAYLRQRFRSAEQQLLQLDDFMEIELKPNQKPKVIKIRGPND